MAELLRGCRRGRRTTGSRIEVGLGRSLVVTVLRLLRRSSLVVLLLGRSIVLVAIGRLRRGLALRVATTVRRLRWVIIALRLLMVLGLRRAVAARIVTRISRHDRAVVAVKRSGGGELLGRLSRV
jgi:hypothetical protein